MKKQNQPKAKTIKPTAAELQTWKQWKAEEDEDQARDLGYAVLSMCSSTDDDDLVALLEAVGVTDATEDDKTNIQIDLLNNRKHVLNGVELHTWTDEDQETLVVMVPKAVKP